MSPTPVRKSLLSVLAGERQDVPPVWMMRQAGRYLPEYRQLRAQAGSFLDLCYNPKLAAEVTLQPVRRFGFDAAILFSDILVIPHALGRRVSFEVGEGPRLDPIDPEGIRALPSRLDPATAAPVYEAIGLVRGALDPAVALLGFCGAPWTVATYMIAGGRSPADQAPTRLFAYREPEAFSRLVEVLVAASIDHLAGQLRAGADAVQIFDTWAGVLPPAEFARWCIEPVRQIVAGVRGRVPNARIIGFPRGAGASLAAFAEAVPVDAVGLDWMAEPAFVREKVQSRVAVQGNLDPLALLAGGEALDRGVEAVLESYAAGPLIFNLGHGILPETPISHVERMLARIRGRR